MTTIPNIVPDAIIDANFFDAPTKDIYNIIKSGDGFTNPIDTLVTTTNTSIDSTISDLSAYTVTGVGNLTGQNVTDTITKLEEMKTVDEDFVVKTNRISGVDRSTGDFPSFQQVTSVGLNSVALEHVLNEAVGNPCGKLATLFLPVILGQGLYEEASTFFQGLMGGIEDLTYDYNEIVSTVDSYITQTELFVTNFETNFNSFVADLIDASLAMTMKDLYRDPCGKYILKEVLGSHRIGDVVDNIL